MNTKLVYVTVCSQSDIFFEQTVVSAWSAKHHNPSIYITVVIDSDSKKSIPSNYYKILLDIIDEEIVIDFEPQISNMVRSRWMKTKLREIVEGDFLYMDVDTVVVGDLSQLDGLKCSVGFVNDFNCLLKDNPSRAFYTKMLKQMFDIEINPNGYYFNGGVFYVKDDPKAHNFMKKWHEGWNYCKEKGYFRDQLSLLKVSQELSDDVERIDGSYNCQISTNLSYFDTAKTLHFYSNHKYQIPFSPFLGKDLYLSIKEKRCLDCEVQNEIINVKRQFNAPTTILSGEDFKVSQSRSFEALCKIYRNNGFLAKLIDFLSKIYLRIFR